MIGEIVQGWTLQLGGNEQGFMTDRGSQCYWNLAFLRLHALTIQNTLIIFFLHLFYLFGIMGINGALNGLLIVVVCRDSSPPKR